MSGKAGGGGGQWPCFVMSVMETTSVCLVKEFALSDY